MENVQFLIQAMKEQIASPARAVVNSESAFVKDRLYKMGQEDLGAQYWSWVCSANRNTPVFGDEVMELQRKLKEIDAAAAPVIVDDKFTWGT
jgi:hypothetical protein